MCASVWIEEHRETERPIFEQTTHRVVDPMLFAHAHLRHIHGRTHTQRARDDGRTESIQPWLVQFQTCDQWREICVNHTDNTHTCGAHCMLCTIHIESLHSVAHGAHTCAMGAKARIQLLCITWHIRLNGTVEHQVFVVVVVRLWPQRLHICVHWLLEKYIVQGCSFSSHRQAILHLTLGYTENMQCNTTKSEQQYDNIIRIGEWSLGLTYRHIFRIIRAFGIYFITN